MCSPQPPTTIKRAEQPCNALLVLGHRGPQCPRPPAGGKKMLEIVFRNRSFGVRVYLLIFISKKRFPDFRAFLRNAKN